MEYITVKLTEDQAKILNAMIEERFELLRDFPNSKDEAAFLRRLRDKLAKAKN